MDTNTIIAALIAFIVGAGSGFGFLLYIRNKKIAVTEESSELIRQYDWEVERYNTLLSLFKRLKEEQMNKAEKANDAAMIANIAFITSNFAETLDEAEKAASVVDVEYTKKRKNNIKVLHDACSKMSDAVDEMELLTDDLGKLKPSTPGSEPKPAQSAGKLAGVMDDPFFYGCDTPELVEQRYKALAKALHPDGKAGNTEMFKVLQHEYNKRRNA